MCTGKGHSLRGRAHRPHNQLLGALNDQQVSLMVMAISAFRRGQGQGQQMSVLVMALM